YNIHGGFFAVLRQGAPRLKLGIRVEGAGDPLEYEFAITEVGGGAVVESESLNAWIDGNQIAVISRPRIGQKVILAEGAGYHDLNIAAEQLALSAFGVKPPHPALSRIVQALSTIDVQPSFHVAARWVAREQRMLTPLREPQLFERATRLARGGANLANAFAELKNSVAPREWDETMDYVRLGLGADVESIITRAEQGGGNIGLHLKYASLEREVPAISLSDGTLAYLALVALLRLKTPRALLTFDEPDLHFHPFLVARLANFCEMMARRHSVLVVTHSDHLLDCLSDPAGSVVLCELDERTRSTRLVRPDPEALEAWLRDYRGLGDLRGAGHQASVMTRPESES
ncbi:MAG TPA: AAA family ATPase, partial [Archangium sp.]|nr:AAA family ATPase [Archangium sp.]